MESCRRVRSVVLVLHLLFIAGLARAQAQASATPKSALLLISGTACTVSVDGEKVADLRADEPARREVAPGEYLVSAVAADGRRWSKVVQVTGSKAIVRIEFAPAVAAAPEPSSAAAGAPAAVPVPSTIAPARAATAPAPAPAAPSPMPGLRSKSLSWVEIPAGEFETGCSTGDEECDRDETPRRRVVIAVPFSMMPRPVTAAQLRDCAGCGGRKPPKQPRWSAEEVPAVNVSWADARDFCEAHEARLPTEAEWEYAARGGSSAARYGALDEIAWYAGNAGGRARAVGQKKPNAFGLYDMLGNVWEWCADIYSPTPGTGEPGAPDGKARVEYVLKGGSWRNKARQLRVSNRGRLSPDERTDDSGFRCVRDLPPEAKAQ